MYQYLQARLTPSITNPAMGFLPPFSIVFTPFIALPTGFNSDGTDNIRVGHAGNDDAYGTDKDVSSAFDLADFTNGDEVGYTDTGKEVFASYSRSGSVPTTGLAIVILPFIRVRKS